MNHLKVVLFTILLVSVSLSMRAQINYDPTPGKENLFHFEVRDQVYNVSRSEELIRQALQLNSIDELQEVRSSIDRNGNQHLQYDIYTSGIKREYETIIVHTNSEGLITFINGEYSNTTRNDVNVEPSISEKIALDRALNHIGASVYRWEDEEMVALFREGNQDPKASLFPSGTLVLYQGTLAYKFIIGALVPESVDEVYVDARKGKVLGTNSLIDHIDVVGTASTRFSGTQSINTTEVGVNPVYLLNDYTRGKGIFTYGLNNSSENYYQATNYSDQDNAWTEYQNVYNVWDALDAHWGAAQVYDYWLTEHNRKSFDDAKLDNGSGQGAQIKSYVHYGTNSSLASWDGQFKVMRFGEGGVSFDGKTSLDAVAHEFAHGVDQFTSNLNNHGESGALDEGLADIWGTCVEHYVNNLNILPQPKELWKFESEIINNAVSLRSLDDPNERFDPDTYKGDYWWTSPANKYGIHTNCTVLGYWFYLATTGGSGVNDHGTSFSVSGMGISAIAQILYETQKNYLTSNSGYYQMRMLTTQVAKTIFGSSSPELNTVIGAWDAVGVTDVIASQPNYCIPQVATPNLGGVSRMGYSIMPNGQGSGYSLQISDLEVYQDQYVPYYISTSITPGSTFYTSTWIDIDQDGDFEYPSEFLASDTILMNSNTAHVTIPPNANPGFTRIRMMYSTTPITSSCNAIDTGYVSDMIIKVLPNTYGACIPWGNNSWNPGPAYAIHEMEVVSTSDPYDFMKCYHQGSTCGYGAASRTGYADQSHLSLDVGLGESYTISLDGYHQYQNLPDADWEAWIDYNQNRIFEESELVHKTTVSTSTTSTGSFTIPFSAVPGETRLRIKLRRYNLPEGACGRIHYGEVEDYRINVLPCDIEAPTITYISQQSQATVGSVYWTPIEGAEKYFVRARPTNDLSWEPSIEVAGSSANYTFDHPGTSYQVQVAAVCQNEVLWSSVHYTFTNCIVPENPVVTKIRSRSATVSWSARTDRFGNVLDYQVFVKKSGPNYPYWSAYNVFNDNEVTFTMLSPDTYYDFKVRTNCEGGTSYFSPVVQFKTSKYDIIKPIFISSSSNSRSTFMSESKIYPNPVQGESNLTVASQSEIQSLEIIDVAGVKRSVVEGENKSHLKVDVTSLPSGVYFMKIYYKNEVESISFIKE